MGIQTRKKKTKKHGYSTRKQGAENEDTATNRLTTRALYDTDEEAEENVLSTEEEEEETVPDDICVDTSDLSDWGVGTGSNLEPPKRKSTRVRKRKKYSSSDETDEDETGSQDSKEKDGKKTKHQAAKIRKNAGRKAAAAVIETQTPEEVLETLRQWRPPDWLTDVIPRKQPYFPQMGDELMYFRQGHELYVSAVERRQTYPIDAKKQPWYKNPSLRYQEAVRIVGVRYELLKNGIRLCCLKLNYIDPVTLKNTGGYFNIKYHDMADVVDFLVLKQNYDLAMTRNWKQGDRFRSMIDDSWWIGVIEQQIPFQEEYSDSMFQCFKVRWDNAEKEYLSPWDLEPVVESRNPSVFGGGILVTQEELKSLMYKPKPNEWPNSTQDEISERLVQGLEQVMSHSIAEPFLTPVDLNVFPSYAMCIEYPMDLNTIKRRLENRFYRRLNAVQFDVRFIESNARKFNEPRSQIVKSAQIMTDALLMFLSDPNLPDACHILTKLLKGRKFQWSESDSGEETEDYDNPDGKKKDDGGEPGTSKKMSNKGRSIGRSLAESLNPDNWKPECQRLLETIFQCEDSGPFREPVDINEYPNYYEVIENPMDLAIVQENLAKDFYSEPSEFARDVRLVFSNSKSFNTNKRSRIYTMTLRLSAMFEAKIKEIIGIWKRAVKYKRRRFPNHISSSEKPGQSTNQPGTSHPSKHPSSTTQPSTSRFTNGRSHSNYNSRRVDDSKTAYAKNRPKREIKPVKKSLGYDSDLDNQDFPDPKPDYSDDDFEIQPYKTSPKKRGSKSESTNGHTNGNRYSTRVKTGIMKPQKYEEEFSEEEEEVVSEVEKTDSDIDPHQYTKIILKSKPSKKRGRKRKKPQYVSSRISSKKIVLSKTVIKKTVDKASESSASNSRSQSSSSSSSSSEDSDMYEEIGVDTGDESELTEPCSPVLVSRSSQGASKKNYSTFDESDSSVERQSKKKIVKQKNYSPLEESDSSLDRQSKKISIRKMNSSEDSNSSVERLSKKKNAKLKHSMKANKSRGRRPARQTRNQGKRTVVYREESENSDNGNNNNEHRTGRSRKKYEEESECSDSPEGSVTVSMRGRIRRPTARARALHDK